VQLHAGCVASEALRHDGVDQDTRDALMTPLLPAVAIIAVSSSGAVQQPRTPVVTRHVGMNNVAGAPWRAGNSDSQYLGLFNTTAQCEWACLKGPPPFGARCCSFTFHTAEYEPAEPQGWNRQCFGVTTGRWHPIPQENITSGKVDWPEGSPGAAACRGRPSTPPPSPPTPTPSGPCATELDCGLNGICLDGACHCRAAWKGERCQTLALEPASLTAGYRHVSAVDGTNQSSWGGSVLWSSEDKHWHMFAAEMALSCGLSAWACNSQVIHATSRSLDQGFVRVNVVQPRFAHEPVVIRAPASGEWVMFFTGCNPHAPNGSLSSCSPRFVAGSEAANCTRLGDGSTPPGAGMKRGQRSNDHTWMSWSLSPAGPWSTPVMVLSGEQIDSNLSPVIARDNSLVGLWRGGLNATRPWSTIQRVTASNWRDPSSYKPQYTDLFPAVHSTEDPHVYMDESNHFHAIFHHCFRCPKNCVCGGHAYSIDGITWHYPYVSGSAYYENVTLASGGVLQFHRRERPHLVFAPDGYTPVALTNGAGIDGIGKYGDATWTFLQPLRQTKIGATFLADQVPN
jgi:hypothetical protein